MSAIHKQTKRDYLGRVNDPEYPKHKASIIAKQYGFDYWDGDRRINYGGYNYIPDRWSPIASAFIDTYNLKNGDNILDIGCGKGFLLYEIKKILRQINIYGVDISEYAIKNSKIEIKNNLYIGDCSELKFPDKFFKFAYSINTFHNLHNNSLYNSLREISRVADKQYICVESYRNELEKMNLLYWQVTCEQFNSPEDWLFWFQMCDYNGDYSFIYFE